MNTPADDPLNTPELERLRTLVQTARADLKGVWKEASQAVVTASVGMVITLALAFVVLCLTMVFFHSPLNFPTLRAWLYDATFPGLVLFPPMWGIGVFTAKWRVRRRYLRDAEYVLRKAEYHARPWSKNGIKLPYPTP